MESGEHERLSRLPDGTLSENQRRLAYPLQHESEVQASITGAVLVHDRSPHLRVSGLPSSCEVNWPAGLLAAGRYRPLIFPLRLELQRLLDEEAEERARGRQTS